MLSLPRPLSAAPPNSATPSKPPASTTWPAPSTARALAKSVPPPPKRRAQMGAPSAPQRAAAEIGHAAEASGHDHLALPVHGDAEGVVPGAAAEAPRPQRLPAGGKPRDEDVLLASALQRATAEVRGAQVGADHDRAAV